MPVKIDEFEAVPAPAAPAKAPETAAASASGKGLRDELRAMNYADGAARLSPRTSAQPEANLPSAIPSQIAGGGASVSANGVVEINASSVKINAATTEVSGTLKADNVVTNKGAPPSAASGAGNVW